MVSAPSLKAAIRSSIDSRVIPVTTATAPAARTGCGRADDPGVRVQDCRGSLRGHGAFSMPVVSVSSLT